MTAQGKSRRRTKEKSQEALNPQAAELEEVEANQLQAKKKQPLAATERKQINLQKKFIDITVEDWLDIDDLLRVKSRRRKGRLEAVTRYQPRTRELSKS